MMVFRLAGLVLILAFGLGHYLSNNEGSRCRCAPNDNCWPSLDAWNHLNETIDGNLVRLRPVGAVCHEEHYSNHACSELIGNYRNTTWRVDNPGKASLFGTSSIKFPLHSDCLLPHSRAPGRYLGVFTSPKRELPSWRSSSKWKM